MRAIELVVNHIAIATKTFHKISLLSAAQIMTAVVSHVNGVNTVY